MHETKYERKEGRKERIKKTLKIRLFKYTWVSRVKLKRYR